MQTSKMIYVTATLIGFLGFQAMARLGENQTQFSTRYGIPREDRGNTNSMRTLSLNCTKTYESQGWRLNATFVNGLAERVDYSKPGRISDQDVQAILQAEAGGGRWSTVNDRTWANSNGAVCERPLFASYISVTSAKSRQREAAEKAARNKPAPAPKF